MINTYRWKENIKNIKNPNFYRRNIDYVLETEPLEDMLTKAVLSEPKRLGYFKVFQGQEKLISPGIKSADKEENAMLDSYLRGLADNPGLKSRWEDGSTSHVRNELEDLLNVYDKAMSALEKKYETTLSHAIEFMKDFIKANEEKKELQHKIDRLIDKLEPTDEES